MSDRRYRKQPPTLPEGYQFGHGRFDAEEYKAVGVVLDHLMASTKHVRLTPDTLAAYFSPKPHSEYQDFNDAPWAV